MAILNKTVSQYLADSGTWPYSAGDTVTIVDTAANIAALSAGDIGSLSTNGVDSIDSSDNTLALSLAQYNALSGVTLTSADTVTLTDTGANLATLSDNDINSLSRIDIIDSNTDAVSLNLAQLEALADFGIGLGAVIALTAGDVVTMADSQANIEALSAGGISGYIAQGVDVIDSSSNVLNLTAAQAAAIVATSATIATGDVATLIDSGANIAGLSATEIGQLASAGFDTINASDNTLALTVAKCNALGAITLTAGDTVTLSDTGANFAGLSASTIAGLSNVDVIDASDNVLALTVAQYNAVINGGIALTAGDVTTLSDTATNLASFSTTQLATLAANVDAINSTTNTVSLTLAQYNVSGVAALFAADDVVTVTGTTGNETITGRYYADRLLGGNGNDVLNGNSGSDVLIGGNGNDTLIGAVGNDSLTGGAGNDIFLFHAAPDKNNNVDTILDFSKVAGNTDRIYLDNDALTALGAGGRALTAAQFHAGSTAQDSSDRILYNKNDGKLWYDADGSGAGAKVLIAIIGASTHPTLTVSDFFIAN